MSKVYFARHAQTLIGSLGRILEHPFAAAMTMGVIAIALALPLLLNVLLQNAERSTGAWNQAFDISVYLSGKGNAGRANALAQRLRGREDVAAVRVLLAEQALDEFRATSGFGQALDALTDNPLPDTLVVTPTIPASTPQGTESLQAAIAMLPEVETVQIDREWVKRLNAMLEILRRVVVMTAVLLSIGAAMVVGNTIRLDILNRRSEIEVMKLVGATDAFARRPFLYSGVWYGLGGGLVAVLVVTLAIAVLQGPVTRVAALYGSAFRLRGLSAVVSLRVVGGAAGLAWTGSWLAATRHIRSIEPT